MLPNEFNAFVRRTPLRPYRITMADGRTYDIDHPDKAAAGFGSVMIGISAKGKNDTYVIHES